MAFCLNEGFVKVTQKIILILLTNFLYNSFSSITPTPSSTAVKAGLKIYPFDKGLHTSSVFIMISLALTIAEYNVWPYNLKPNNRLLKFIGEVRKRRVIRRNISLKIKKNRPFFIFHFFLFQKFVFIISLD